MMILPIRHADLMQAGKSGDRPFWNGTASEGHRARHLGIAIEDV